MYTSKAGRPSSFFLFFSGFCLGAIPMYSLVFLLAFSCLICLFLFLLFLLSPFILVGRKRRKKDNDNDDDARFCRVYMSGTRSGLYVIIDGVI